jgi:hydrogenase/urease accessory protein HupE
MMRPATSGFTAPRALVRGVAHCAPATGAALRASVAIVVLLAPILLILTSASPARAHGLEPALLTLHEIRSGVFEVAWKSSKVRLPGADVVPRLPARCKALGTGEEIDHGDRTELRWTVDCGPDGLTGESVGVDGLEVARITALLLVERLDGSNTQTVLNARAPALVVPATPSRWSLLRGYVALGIEHILSGPDHLLFVLGLLLLVPTTRLLIETITAFTVGHSITLSAAALDLAHVPSRPIEVLIAASVLLLAVELARDGAHDTLLRRFPWLAALAFGLLHGFGFAGALAEAGLPQRDVPLALLAFNVGIELGQLAFVFVVLGTVALLTRVAAGRGAARTRWAVVYAMGILSAYWVFERTALLLG